MATTSSHAKPIKLPFYTPGSSMNPFVCPSCGCQLELASEHSKDTRGLTSARICLVQGKQEGLPLAVSKAAARRVSIGLPRAQPEESRRRKRRLPVSALSAGSKPTKKKKVLNKPWAKATSEVAKSEVTQSPSPIESPDHGCESDEVEDDETGVPLDADLWHESGPAELDKQNDDENDGFNFNEDFDIEEDDDAVKGQDNAKGEEAASDNIKNALSSAPWRSGVGVHYCLPTAKCFPRALMPTPPIGPPPARLRINPPPPPVSMTTTKTESDNAVDYFM